MNIKDIRKYIIKCNREIGALSKSLDGSVFTFIHLWIDFIWCSIIHGCLIRQYVYGEFYRQREFDRRKSLTYRRILRLYKICNHPNYIKFLNDKKLFNRHFENYVKRDWLYSYDMTLNQFKDFTRKHSSAIIKPLTLCEGEGVYKINLPSSDLENEDMRDPECLSLFNKLKSSECLIEECIKQHPDMQMGGKSVNTIRMHTLLTNDNRVICFKPMFRVGVGQAVIDNYCAGGCVYEVDVEDGIVIGTSLSKDHNRHKIHPGTNITVLGYHIPNWDVLINEIKKAALQLPQCRFIGWDIAITESGIELIEGNHNPDYELLEFQGTKGWWGKLKQHL